MMYFMWGLALYFSVIGDKEDYFKEETLKEKKTFSTALVHKFILKLMKTKNCKAKFENSETSFSSHLSP